MWWCGIYLTCVVIKRNTCSLIWRVKQTFLLTRFLSVLEFFKEIIIFNVKSIRQLILFAKQFGQRSFIHPEYVVTNNFNISTFRLGLNNCFIFILTVPLIFLLKLQFYRRIIFVRYIVYCSCATPQPDQMKWWDFIFSS